MNLNVSKTALALLVVALIILFAASNIMYGKANETILIQIVERQTLDSNRLMKMVIEKQKEVDMLKEELHSLKMDALKTAAPSSAKE